MEQEIESRIMDKEGDENKVTEKDLTEIDK